MSETEPQAQPTATQIVPGPVLPGPVSPNPAAPIFTSEPPGRGSLPIGAWGAAALVVVVVVGALVFAGRKKPAPAPSTLQPADAYAASLPLSQLAMSESTSLSGGKLTYLDGHVVNSGNRTVAGVTVQVVFQNDEQLAPQIETLPLTLIRMKDPYIDTEPVSANPIKPGDDRDPRQLEHPDARGARDQDRAALDPP
jgi:hypothetical protein